MNFFIVVLAQKGTQYITPESNFIQTKFQET